MNPKRNEAGFSLIGMLVLLAILGGGIRAGYMILPVYNTYWKVQDTFDSVTRHLSNLSASEIRERLPDILHVQSLKPSDLPKAFYDHLDIKADGRHVEISSSYDVAVWLLGKPEGTDQAGGDAVSDPQGMDSLRYKGRVDFHFHPYAKTP